MAEYTYKKHDNGLTYRYRNGVIQDDVYNFELHLLQRINQLEQERNADIESYNAALEFALEALDSAYDTILFLRLWREGCWPEIEDQFPEFDLGTAAPCGYMAVSEQTEGE